MGDYYEIAADHVDPAARHVAHEAVRLACYDLGIPDAHRPAVRWFSAETPHDRQYIARHGAHFAERLTTDGNGILEGRSIRGENVIWKAGAPRRLLTGMATTSRATSSTGRRQKTGSPGGAASTRRHLPTTTSRSAGD